MPGGVFFEKGFKYLSGAAEKGLAKVGIKITGEKAATSGAKALAKMAEDGRGTFAKLTEKLAKERGISSARFGKDLAHAPARKAAQHMVDEAGHGLSRVGALGSKAVMRNGRQVFRPVISVATRGSEITSRGLGEMASRAVNQTVRAIHVPPTSLSMRYGQYVDRILSQMNPVQRFFYNLQRQWDYMLSRFLGFNGSFMKREADHFGRLAFEDAKLAEIPWLRSGEKLYATDLLGDPLEASLSKTVFSGRGGRALSNIAQQSAGRYFERLTGKKLFATVSETGEKAVEQVAAKATNQEVKIAAEEATEQLVHQGSKEAVETSVKQGAEHTVENTIESAAADIGEEVVNAEGKAASHAVRGAEKKAVEDSIKDTTKEDAEALTKEWKNVAKDELKVGDRIRLVGNDGKALKGSDVVIKDIKDGKFTIEAISHPGDLIHNQTFEKQVIQRLEESVGRNTGEQVGEDIAKKSTETAAATAAKEGVADATKETAERLEKKATNGGLFDLTEDFQKKMNEAETFQWKVNKMMDKSLAKQKEAIDKLYEAAKAETNPSSAAKMLSGATEKETALSLKIAENLQKQKELIEGVDRRVAQEAELAARKEAEKAAEKANPFELPEKLMNRLRSRPKELAQWNMNKAAWEGLQEQRRAVDKLYEAAAKTTNLRESAKLTSEAAEKSAALQKQAAEIMQKHVDLAGRLNKTLFRQGAEKVVQNPKQLLGWSGAILGSGMAVSGIASGKGALDPFFKTLFGQQYEQNGLGGVIVKTVIGEKNQKAAADKLSQLGQKTGNAVAENAPKVATEVGRIYNGIADDAAAINQEAGNAYNNIKGAVTGLYHGNQQISDGQGGYYDSTTQQYEGVPQNGTSSQYAMGLARNTMDSFSGGNVSKMDLGSLIAASVLGFGRFGLIGKAIGAVMAGSTIHNINKRGQSTQQVQQSQVYAPSQSQAVRQTQEYNASVYQHPEVSFDESESTQHSRHI